MASQMHMQWGQYIDHDLVFTEVMPGSDCCKDLRHTCVHPDTYTDGPCFPIEIAKGDRYFNGSCMPFKRSFATKVNGVREQISGATSFLDASTVYGSNQAHQNDLRAFKNGLMKVEEGNLLPIENRLKCTRHQTRQKRCPFGGDTRVNVFQGLTILHLMFVREHNRLAHKLHLQNPHWEDEELFQEARRINIAIHQKINYEEYLPSVIGPLAMDAFQLTPNNYVYEPKTNPNIINSFAAAAFRFGHSQINGILKINSEDIPISEMFFNPFRAVESEETIKSIIRSQTRRNCQSVSSEMTTEVTDLLFLHVDEFGHSTDLAARNVQRDRDHGIPPYLDFLDLSIQKFNLNNETFGWPNYTLPKCMTSRVYNSVKDLDLFVGGIAEEHLPGALVGPTYAYIIAEQFRRLKFGDRYYFETKDPVVGFTPDQLREVKKFTFAHVLCRNSRISHLQPNVFEIPSKENKIQSCNKYEDIDFSPWAEQVSD